MACHTLPSLPFLSAELTALTLFASVSIQVSDGAGIRRPLLVRPCTAFVTSSSVCDAPGDGPEPPDILLTDV